MKPGPALARLLAGLAAFAALAACFSPEPPLPVRYFEPRLPASAGDAAPAGPVVRLRRVRAASHLKDRMVRRLSDLEYGFSELDRWAEPPVAYLQRALENELFQTEGLRRSDSSLAASLDVELLAFEEEAGGDSVRAAVRVSLTGTDQLSLLDRTFEARRPLGEGEPGTVAAALGDALGEVVHDLAAAVHAALLPGS